MIVVFVLSWAAVIVAPGMFLARRLAADAEAAPRLAFAIALGLLCVGWGGWTLSALVGLALPLHLDRTVLAVAALATSGLTWWRTRGTPVKRPRAWTRADLAALTLAVTAGATWMARFDSLTFTQHHCMPASALIALTDFLSGYAPDLPASMVGKNLTLMARFGQNEGAVALLATHVATLEAFGPRWAMGVEGALASLAGYGLGRALWARPAWALALAACVAGSPFALAIRHPNPNLTSYALVVTVLALAIGIGRDRPAWVGALAGLAVAVSHHLLPAALALPLVLWPRAEWRAVARRYAVGLGWALLPSVLAHGAMLFGDQPASFESFQKYPSVRHCIGPACFDWHGLLNWPFAPELYRDPHRALPALLRFPAELLARHGLLAIGLAAVGFVCAARNDARRVLLQCMPAVLALPPLLAQANWVDRAKSGTILPLLPPLYVLAVAGARRLVDPRSRRRALVVLAVAVALSAVAVTLAKRARFPVDPRLPSLYAEWDGKGTPRSAPELVEHVAVDRAVTTALAWLPDLGGASFGGPGASIASLAAAGRQPRFRDFTVSPSDRMLRLLGVGGELVPPGLSALARAHGGDPDQLPLAARDSRAVALVLDLSRPLHGRDDFLRAASAVDAGADAGAVDVDLTDLDDAIVTSLGASWHGPESALVALRHGPLVWLAIANLPSAVLEASAGRGVRVVDVGGRERVVVRVGADARVVTTDLIAWEPSWDLSWEATARHGPWRARPLAYTFD